MVRVPPTVAFAACTFIWGTTWLAIKIGYGGLDAVWGASLRFLLAGSILVPVAAAMGLGRPRGRRQLLVVAFVGLVLFGLDYGLIYWGEQFITSGLTAILFATMPLFVALFATVLIPSERITLGHALGVLLGLGGLGLIFADDLRAGVSIGPLLAIVTSAAAAGSASVVVRRWGRDLHPMVLNASAMLLGGIALLVASLLLGESPGLPSTANAWAALGYLIALGSIVSFLLYWNLLKQWTANRAGLVPILTPVVAVLTGLLVHETMTPMQWLGSLVVLAGVALALVPLPTRGLRLVPAMGGGK